MAKKFAKIQAIIYSWDNRNPNGDIAEMVSEAIEKESKKKNRLTDLLECLNGWFPTDWLDWFPSQPR